MKLSGLSGVVICLLLAGCNRPSGPFPSEKVAAQPQWYQLGNGVFQDITTGFLAVEPQPWTTQERVVSFVTLHDRLFVAINGRGIVAIRPGQARPFDYHYERDLFSDRTFGGVAARDDHLVCHFYVNELLGSADLEGSLSADVNLIKLYPGSGGHTIDFVSPPSQRQKDGWQIVGFHPIEGSRYALEWKRSTEDLVDSRYTLFDMDSVQEVPISRDEFRAALQVVQLNGESREAGPTLNLLINQVVSELPDDTYLSLQLSQSRRIERFLLLPDSGSDGAIVEVPIIRGRGDLEFLALLPDGRLFSIGTGDRSPRQTALPALPAGLQYTDLALLDDWLIVSWEQVDFYRVGAAGLMMTPFSP